MRKQTLQVANSVCTIYPPSRRISIIGVGVTEAGLSGPDSPSLHHIYEILLKIRSLIASKKLKSPNPTGKICVINTDNVPGNGSIIRKHLVEIAKKSKGGEQSVCETTDSSESDSFIGFLDKHISFHNTMVDRITSQRENSGGMVPRCEPVPAKALVVEDLTSSLPSAFSSDYVKSEFGVVVRKDKGELDFDIVAKLRIANGTHTAVAHTMALSSLLMTDVLARDESYEAATILMKYLDSFVKDQVLASRDMQARTLEAEAAWDDWRRRLCHPAFGLSTFFITQNGEKKGGIRMSPTIKNLMESGNGHVSVAASFAFAALLRFHTPRDAFNANHSDGIYKGWLDSTTEAGTDDVVYADGLRYNLSEGWYEFRGHCKVGGQSSSENASISALLGKASRGDGSQPIVFLDAIKAYLREKDGGNMADCNTLDFENFAISTATLYARMLSDNLLSILKEIASNKDIYTHGFATKCSVLVDGSPIVSD